MHNKPLSRRSIVKIKAAIATASAYAEEKKVPLTAERLAAALDMDIALFRLIVDGQYTEQNVAPSELAAKVSLIQHAFAEATASVMEHAMGRGSSANMHMLYLKENAGYGEKGDAPLPAVAPVIFVGEEDIP